MLVNLIANTSFGSDVPTALNLVVHQTLLPRPSHKTTAMGGAAPRATFSWHPEANLSNDNALLRQLAVSTCLRSDLAGF